MSTALAPGAPAGTDLLERVTALHVAEAAAARAKMELVAEWAVGHPAPGLRDLDRHEVHADHEVLLAGPGAPGVSEFAVVELAAAIGMSTAAGKRYVGDVVELANRLPAVWARIASGDLAAWKARSVAQRTKQLSAEAAAWVDERVAPVAHRIGPAQLGRLVENAITLFDSEVEVEATLAETYVTIRPAGAGGLGLSDLAHVEATLCLDDALALEAAVSARAHGLIADQPQKCLDERRALALGSLARGEGHQDLSLVVHLGEPEMAQKHLARARTSTGIEHLVTTEAVAAWCDRPDVRVSIKPVLDLNQPISGAGYAPSGRLRDQVTMLAPTCTFPHCTVPAERCDLDHITAWDAGGPTTTSNLAPLCRLHHRIKTFGGWSYIQTAPGAYLWISPAGRLYQRDRGGTTPSTSATAGAIARSALPRCEIASFSDTESSADVLPSGVSVATKSGS